MKLLDRIYRWTWEGSHEQQLWWTLAVIGGIPAAIIVASLLFAWVLSILL